MELSMGVRYEWADEHQVIVNIFLEAPWTWQEYHEITGRLMAEIREMNRPCATVVDVRQMGPLPRDGNIIQILLNVDKAMPETVFASAIVGTPYGVMVFMNMLTKLSSHAKRMAIFTQSIEEAHEAILARYKELEEKKR